MKATKMAVEAASAPQYLQSLAASKSTSLRSWQMSTMEPTRKNLQCSKSSQGLQGQQMLYLTLTEGHTSQSEVSCFSKRLEANLWAPPTLLGEMMHACGADAGYERIYHAALTIYTSSMSSPPGEQVVWHVTELARKILCI